MYYVYILENKEGRHYIGSCEDVSKDGISIDTLRADINKEMEGWGTSFFLKINQIRPEDILKNLVKHYLEDENLPDQEMDISRFGQGMQRHLLTYVKVIENILSPLPWQFRSPDARPKESFRMPEPLSRNPNEFFEIIRIPGDTVSGRMLHVRPYKLIGIKLRGIPREKIGINAGAVFKEPFDRPRLMHTASIPEKHEPSLQMPKKIPQESYDLGMSDILQGMEANIQSDSPFACRNADSGNSRDFRPSSGDFKDGRLADKRPSLFDCWDKAKSALVEENQGDLKLFGLFLYAATCSASNALFPSHRVPWPWSRVSDSLSPFRLGATRCYWDDRKLETSFRSPGRFSGSSKDRSNIRSSRPHPQAHLLNFSSGARLASRAVRERVLISRPHLLFSHTPLSTGVRNLPNNRLSWLLPTDSVLYPRAQRPAGAAVQALSGFHEVSWNHDNTIKGLFLLLLRNSIIHLRRPLNQTPLLYLLVLINYYHTQSIAQNSG